MRNHFLRFLFLLLAAVPAARGYTDSKPLRFDLYRGYLIVARGSAGAQKGLNFLIDTGSSPTVLDRRLAQKLLLHETSGVLAGISGRVQAGLATVPSLRLGPIQRNNMPVVVEDLSFFSKALSVRIDAVIGLDLVGQSSFEIDYARSEMIFGPIAPLQNALSLQMKAGLPIIDGEVDHLPAHLVLDTAASSLILFEPKQAAIARVNADAVQHSSTMMGQFDRKPILLASLKLGQAEFRRQPAFLTQSRWDGTDDFAGLVSPAFLGISKLVIDVGRGMVEFTR